MRPLSRPAVTYGLLVAAILLAFGYRYARMPWVVGSDGLAYYAYVRSLVIDGNLDFENEFRQFNPYGHAVPDPDRRTATGYVINKYPVGCALLWLPFFLLAHLLTLFLNATGLATLPMNGYATLYQVLTTVGTIAYGVWGLFLIRKFCRRFFAARLVDGAVVVFVAATHLIYYFFAEPTMSHVLSMFAVSGFAWFWLRDFGRKTAGSYLRLAPWAGLMIMIRYQNGLFLFLPLIEMIQVTFGNGLVFSKIRQALGRGIVFLLAVAMVLLPQLLTWRILYGKWVVYSYAGEGFNFASPALWAVLFSSRHGLISWTPLLFFCIWGAFWFIKTDAVIGTYLILMLGVTWYINAAWENWWFGAAYGARSFLSCSFIFVLGLCAFADRMRLARRPWLLYPAAVLLICWNVLFIAQYGLGLVSADGCISWGQMIKNQLYLIRNVGILFG